ncbi:uncharacterized protein Z520_10867 [Fonsecaea multimorphosa CBS 102226]|uniref:Uncharacterized protein n=1 Tax=Fonsecaea multimorphosa CBS 102226 TaxID=1442371 RepID=A0A0D2KAJ5_9EURO|nr:uncharacterized protein Z520_10867 [Fonsecaea multimorphosa CBS 102226]KIX93448.1 hypothetical protein Z520_10867 [Fonsecaea multimorphosa CBS 102226]OAL18745.1 hypothetical protein AYO22_10438 [Fonsecaea multimorphosa]
MASPPPFLPTNTSEMSSNPTTTPTPATPSPRPDIKGRSASDGSQCAITTSRTLSPATTLSPLSTESSPSSPPGRAHLSFPFPFSRSSSKSPRPPPIDLNIPPSGTNLKQHTQTSPAHPAQSPSHDHPRTQTQRHTSDSAILSPSAMATSPLPSPDLQKRDSWIQKKPRHSGRSPGGYGRHSDDWLFNGISITQTAKEIVHRSRRTSKKEDGGGGGDDAAGHR